MATPLEFARMPVEVKFNLTSYRAWLDCWIALDIMRHRQQRYVEWKIEWAGICSLLRTSLSLIGLKDVNSCLPEALRNQLKEDWDNLRKNKTAYPLYNEFILKERNNILHEYEFSAYEAIIRPDGTVKPKVALLYILQDGEKEALVIRNGYYAGRQAIHVLSDAVEWVRDFIYGSIRKAGYDPDERRYPGTLLPVLPMNPPDLRLLSVLTGEDDNRPLP